MRWLSNSIEVIFLAFFMSSSVRTPRPGPISITWSVDFMFAALTIFFKMPALIKKFWPKRFFVNRP